jgi:hypothetical protein
MSQDQENIIINKIKELKLEYKKNVYDLRILRLNSLLKSNNIVTLFDNMYIKNIKFNIDEKNKEWSISYVYENNEYDENKEYINDKDTEYEKYEIKYTNNKVNKNKKDNNKINKDNDNKKDNNEINKDNNKINKDNDNKKDNNEINKDNNTLNQHDTYKYNDNDNKDNNNKDNDNKDNNNKDNDTLNQHDTYKYKDKDNKDKDKDNKDNEYDKDNEKFKINNITIKNKYIKKVNIKLLYYDKKYKIIGNNSRFKIYINSKNVIRIIFKDLDDEYNLEEQIDLVKKLLNNLYIPEYLALQILYSISFNQWDGDDIFNYLAI